LAIVAIACVVLAIFLHSPSRRRLVPLAVDVGTLTLAASLSQIDVCADYYFFECFGEIS
jgi:hypothetical protein